MTSRATRAMLCATLLAAGLSLSGPVNAAFISGVWQGDANYDTEGKFSDCTMTAQASSGVLIGFIISKGFEWGLVLADETREFEVGTTESVALHIDQRDPIPAIAKVIDVHGIVIPLENSARVLDALREGEVLTIVAEKGQYQLQVDRHQGSDRRACRLRHREPHQREGRCLDRHAASYGGACSISGARTASRCRRA